MYKGKKIVVLIAAAGNGRRMGTATPKQFLSIGDKTLLEKATEAFDNSASVDAIYIIAGQNYMADVKASLTNSQDQSKVKDVIKGGSTRQESVLNGLNRIRDEADIVLIHDAARPYISTGLIERIIQGVFEHHAVIPAIPAKDTIKIVNGDMVGDTPERSKVYCAQTPQGFDTNIILKAHEEAKTNGFVGTDDAQLVERLEEKVHIIEGEEKNIKVTIKGDLPQSKRNVGIGFDVHAFAEDRDLILGGVNIPYVKGLQGHSDADVLTHALMDAILGALALGDIGTKFPDTDMKYKDASSLLLLKEVADLMTKKGYTLENADMVIVAEKPKMMNHIGKMKDKLAGILDVKPEQISIKATTTEKLGFTGREEGIAAQAIVQLIKDEER